MEFRLTYEGLLFSTQNSPLGGQVDPRAKQKQELRKVFHLQLKRLWEINPYLKYGNPVEFDWEGITAPRGSGVQYGSSLAEWLAPKYARNGYNFVPLVRRDLALICALEILFLRPDSPGAVLQSGDIDNRLKTLFDGLRMPRDARELGGYVVPGVDEDPFFCLLEDDSLITHVAVETDTLLQPTGQRFDPNDARIVIRVRLRPYSVNPSNEGFG